MRIGLVTCSTYPDLSASDSLLGDELRRRGHELEVVRWNGEEGATADELDVVVLRSSWDYHGAVDDYRSWLRHVAAGAVLVNPLELVEWSLDKTYLLDLQARGATLPATVLVEPGFTWAIGDERTVVKPRVGASGVGVHIAEPGEVSGLLADPETHRGLMLQALVDDVGGGEWALSFFGGEYSHAFQRVPADGEFRVNSGFGGYVRAGDASSGLIEFASHAMTLLPVAAAYARVDIIETADGPILLELEVNEPSMRLDLGPQAPAMFADAVLAQVERR